MYIIIQMGNTLLCHCEKANITTIDEVKLPLNNRRNNEFTLHPNFTFGPEHVKSANRLQNQFRRFKGFEKLKQIVKLRIFESNSQMSEKFEEVNFGSFNNKIKEILTKFECDVKEMNTSTKRKTLIKMPPMRNSKENFIYEGEWNTKGEIEGLGKMECEDGSVYYGYINNYSYEGCGILVNTSGDYYLGTWKDSAMNGKGIMYSSKFGIKYDGTWKDNLKDGKGEEVYSDGSVFKGYFKKGHREGEGTFYWADGTVYNGNFHNSMMNGFGELKWPDGRVYRGNLVENQTNGTGTQYWPNGNSYEGHYINGMKSGEGTFTWTSDKFFKGQWLNNKQHGFGIANIKENTYSGTWRFGKAITLTKNKKDKINEDENKC